MKPSILVVGDVMLDKYVYVRTGRISGEAPVMIVKETGIEYRLGGAGNVASNLASLGVRTCVVGEVNARDEGGREIIKLCGDKDIILYPLRFEKPTIVKQRFICNGYQLLRVDIEKTDKVKNIGEINNGLLRGKYDAIVVSDYDKGMITEEVMAELKKSGTKIIVNGKPENILLYKGVDVVTFNRYEVDKAIRAVKEVRDEIDLRNFYNIGSLVVTKGADGVDVFTKRRMVTLPGWKVDVKDITGAGDVIVAVIAMGLAMKHNISTVTEYANKLAAYSVTQFGSYSVKREDIDKIKEF